jgi:hypothetical protein
MFTTFMQRGSYRIDYMNQTRFGQPDALAFYVRGCIESGEVYSSQAKRHLFAGLAAIQQNFGWENLVAIYLDIDVLENLKRPAYLQLKQDLRRRFFTKVLVSDPEDIMGVPEADSDISALFQDTGGFKLLVSGCLECSSVPSGVILAGHLMDCSTVFSACK